MVYRTGLRYARLQKQNHCGECPQCRQVQGMLENSDALASHHTLLALFRHRLEQCSVLNTWISENDIWCTRCIGCENACNDEIQKTSHCFELQQWRAAKAEKDLDAYFVQLEADSLTERLNAAQDRVRNLLADQNFCGQCFSCKELGRRLAQDDLDGESWCNFFIRRLCNCTTLQEFIRANPIKCGDCFQCQGTGSDPAWTCFELCKWRQWKALDAVKAERTRRRTRIEMQRCRAVLEQAQTAEGCKWQRGQAAALCNEARMVVVPGNFLHSPLPSWHVDITFPVPGISKSWSWEGAWPIGGSRRF